MIHLKGALLSNS